MNVFAYKEKGHRGRSFLLTLSSQKTWLLFVLIDGRTPQVAWVGDTEISRVDPQLQNSL